MRPALGQFGPIGLNFERPRLRVNPSMRQASELRCELSASSAYVEQKVAALSTTTTDPEQRITEILRAFVSGSICRGWESITP